VVDAPVTEVYIIEMAEYVIRVRETTIAEYSVEADSPKDSAALAHDVVNIEDRAEIECISREVEEITEITEWERKQA